jgi:2,4-dienoyl-CoA reductase (NADPH2)
VTIIESSDTIGKGMVDLLLNHLMVWFQKKGVVLKTSVKRIEIVPKGVAITMQDGSRSVIEVDTVVPAVPLSADTDLYSSLEGKVPEVHAVGDCKEPLLIVDAVSAGSRVARAI